ncbi:uncharacterized protein LOC144658239 [Oculina patagonica]
MLSLDGETSQCEEDFGTNCPNIGQLNRHERVPKGEKPFQRSQCGEMCTQRKDMNDQEAGMLAEKGYIKRRLIVRKETNMDSYHMTHQTYSFCQTASQEDQCYKVFGRIDQLQDHTKKRAKAKSFKCTQCSRCYSTPGVLKHHRRAHCKVKRPFKCDQCHKRYTQARYLLQHNKIHTGDREKPFKCNQCVKSLAHESTLIQHIKRIHTGEKPFKCNQCGKCFTWTEQLKRHKQTHTGEKPFECNQCGRCFKTIQQIKQHIARHKGELPFECNQCGERFNCAARLKDHTRFHTGERPLKCNKFGKCFKQSKSLRRHRTSHNREKIRNNKKDNNNFCISELLDNLKQIKQENC